MTRAFPQGRSMLLALVSIALAAGAAASGQSTAGGSVLTYHGRTDRSGNFVVPDLTFDRGRTLRLDDKFQPRITGHLYAQPLYWLPPGADHGQLLVATEDNVVYALDAVTGRE